MEVYQSFQEGNLQIITIFISSIAAKIINLSYFCSLYLILLTLRRIFASGDITFGDIISVYISSMFVIYQPHIIPEENNIYVV